MLTLNWIEILGFVTGAVCVWLAVKENVWNWPIAAANAVFFFILFFRHRLYGDMALQVIFFGLAVLGWYRWLRGGANHSTLPVSNITARLAIALSLVTLLATALMAEYLRRINDAAPVLDALTTVLSLVGQYLLTQKVIENWYVWMLADVLYVIFLAMCIAGALEWQRSVRSPSPAV